MRNGFGHGQSLDAPRSPFSGDLLTRDAPDLLSVVLEECTVEPVTKAIDKKILQGVFRRTLNDLRLAVAQADAQSLDQPHVLQRARIELERIIEEPSAVENPRKSLTDQHDRIGGGRSKYGRKHVVRLTLVTDAQRLVSGRLAFGHRQYLLPPAHHPIGFRKEPVAAEIHAISAVIDGFGDSADLAVGLEHDGHYIR